MRACLQRVTHASVYVDNQIVGSCKQGFMILLGVGPDDTEKTAQALWNKIYGLRIFNDEHGRMNVSLADIDGEVLVISQFTLYANARRGKRPSFVEAADPQLGNRLYEKFCEFAAHDVSHVGRGIFGADMQVELVNDGPVTIWLDSKTLGF
ncbi:D-aminoacyl-tRNA deacylase [Atopobium fossor]|uniref:D-aminoacyl-tRNA deacylase n=1 Tax=Atopobium fossor TaxID=39487 RepID=UPI000428AEBE|nr:D-aminoacyl-tRNA deacylase [Atopobium fossor]